MTFIRSTSFNLVLWTRGLVPFDVCFWTQWRTLKVGTHLSSHWWRWSLQASNFIWQILKVRGYSQPSLSSQVTILMTSGPGHLGLIHCRMENASNCITSWHCQSQKGSRKQTSIEMSRYTANSEEIKIVRTPHLMVNIWTWKQTIYFWWLPSRRAIPTMALREDNGEP